MSDTPRDGDAERLSELRQDWLSAPIVDGRRSRPKGQFISWRDIDLLLRELDSRDAALREARSEIENLKCDISRALAAASGEAAEVNRLREHSAAKDEVVEAARRVCNPNAPRVESTVLLTVALARLDAAPEGEHIAVPDPASDSAGRGDGHRRRYGTGR